MADDTGATDLRGGQCLDRCLPLVSATALERLVDLLADAATVALVRALRSRNRTEAVVRAYLLRRDDRERQGDDAAIYALRHRSNKVVALQHRWDARG
ncbi:MAG: hypothetical protein ABIP49_08680 [Lysobacterales bacterium]